MNALELAEQLETEAATGLYIFKAKTTHQAADEIRRLHAINAELEEKVKKLEAAIESLKRTYINANFQRYL